jgi:hypothetical protein
MDGFVLEDILQAENKNKADLFHMLKIADQVYYINKCIDLGETLTSIEQKQKIYKKSNRIKFKEAGYILFDKKYILDPRIADGRNAALAESPKNLDKDNTIDDWTPEEAPDETDAGLWPIEDTKYKEATEDHEKIKLLSERLDNLLDIVTNYGNILYDLDRELGKSKQLPDKENQSRSIKISSEVMAGDLKTRSFKVYTETLLNFIKFCNDNKSFKQQDLISQALHEFMLKYE